MGLEILEIIMRVEETFEIEIGDAEASGLHSVGNVYTCVLAKLGLAASDRCMSSVTFYRIRRALMGLSGAPRQCIRPSTVINLLLPPGNRKEQWTYLSQMTGTELPGLQRPPWMRRTTGGVSLFLAGRSGVAMLQTSVDPALMWLGRGFSFAWLASKGTAPFANQIPANCRTVHDLTKAVLRLNYGIHTENRQATIEHSWTAASVWDALHALIADELSVEPGTVLNETQFVRDLDLG